VTDNSSTNVLYKDNNNIIKLVIFLDLMQLAIACIALFRKH
jgi:hypothetical protein